MNDVQHINRILGQMREYLEREWGMLREQYEDEQWEEDDLAKIPVISQAYGTLVLAMAALERTPPGGESKEP